MSEQRILTELHPYTYELCSLYYTGMGDPLYEVLSLYSMRRVGYATDFNLPWSTGAGDGFYAPLTRAQIHALRRAGEKFPATINDCDRNPPYACEMNEVELAEEAAEFFAGVHWEGHWPVKLDIGDDDEPDAPAPSLFNHPVHGLMLMGDEARRRIDPTFRT